jgi:hypothetical protein
MASEHCERLPMTAWRLLGQPVRQGGLIGEVGGLEQVTGAQQGVSGPRRFRGGIKSINFKAIEKSTLV